MSTSEGTRRGLSENGMSMLHLQTSGFQLIGLLFYVDIPSNVSEGIELDFFFFCTVSVGICLTFPSTLYILKGV
jgi:hypothetical protein